MSDLGSSSSIKLYYTQNPRLLMGIKERVCLCLSTDLRGFSSSNKLRGRGIEFRYVQSNSFLIPPLPRCVKGIIMSMMKDGQRWRWNEPSRVVEFFHCKLKALLQSRPDLNITILAEMLGKTPASVSNWVNGLSVPPSDIQELIAQIFGCENRAEIWQWKGVKVTNHILKINKLNKALEHEKELVKKELNGGH